MAVTASLAAACADVPRLATTSVGGQSTPRGNDDLGALVPAGTETVLEIDLAALRASPWSRGIFASASADERARHAERRGFDEMMDVDKAVFAGGSRDPASLTLAQGRFERDRVARAFADDLRASDGEPAASSVESSWRGVSVWHDGGGGRAIAFLTPQTLLSGPLAAVRGAIDCALGAAPDACAERGLADARSALEGGPAARPALRLAAIVTEGLRARVRGELWAEGSGDALRAVQRVGARLDVGSGLDVDVVAWLDSARDADLLAASLAALIRDLKARRALNAFGLAPFLDFRVAARGPRVLGGLHIDEDRREDLAAKLGAVAQAIAAHKGGGGAGSEEER